MIDVVDKPDQFEKPDHHVLREMQALATRIYPTAGWRHAGDIAWAWTLAGEKLPTAIWREDGGIVAWAWFESAEELTLQVDPAHPELAYEALAWALRTADTEFSVTIAATEQHLVPALTSHGFVAQQDGPFFSCLSRRLTDGLPPSPALPEGYVIRHVEDEDIPARAEVHRASWNSTGITTERHASMRQLWSYRPEFDLVAYSPEDIPTAYYQGWYDDLSGIGLFEPVGTRPEHRRLGLSRAVGIALLHAFAAAGGKLAVVCPRGDDAYPVPKVVYESMGFREYTRTLTYRRNPRAD